MKFVAFTILKNVNFLKNSCEIRYNRSNFIAQSSAEARYGPGAGADMFYKAFTLR